MIALGIIGAFVLLVMGLGYFEYRAAVREAARRDGE